MMSRAKTLQQMYSLMLKHFGEQAWWPADSDFEVCVGAILTQNTSWNNVEKAISNLKQAAVMSFESLHACSDERIAEYIRPAGYFRVKTKRLRNFLNFVAQQPQGFDSLYQLPTDNLYQQLMSVSGIGPETADSMVLYAFKRPRFVVDAYTKRILIRHGEVGEDADYHYIQDFFESGLKSDHSLFNEFHALIVMIGKHYCHTKKTLCQQCPLNGWAGHEPL